MRFWKCGNQALRTFTRRQLSKERENRFTQRSEKNTLHKSGATRIRDGCKEKYR
jgi:hypothetical protein